MHVELSADVSQAVRLLNSPQQKAHLCLVLANVSMLTHKTKMMVNMVNISLLSLLMTVSETMLAC